MTKVTITSATVDKAVEITAHAAAAAMDAAIGKKPRRRPGKRERDAAQKQSGSNAERIAKYSEKFADALLVSAIDPSPDVRRAAVEEMLMMPTFSVSHRYYKYKTIAEAAWPEVEFNHDLMMSWSVDEGLPLAQRLVGSLLLDLALNDSIRPDKAHFTNKELADIVAEAKELAKNIGPAQDAFNEANEAWTATNGEGEEALLARQNEAESVWWHHLDRFSEAAERLFDLPAPTAADRARIVRAYADLMAPVFGVPEGDDTLASLPTENLLQVISYLDGTRPKTLQGRDAIREAWVEAKAAANPELLAAE